MNKFNFLYILIFLAIGCSNEAVEIPESDLDATLIHSLKQSSLTGEVDFYTMPSGNEYKDIPNQDP
ncbi:MAG TPA: hypothetical protein PLC27_08850, partial [Saprospiraceae bacterium]|nr:hypothetical protein [Saprospiraceae bacterium]